MEKISYFRKMGIFPFRSGVYVFQTQLIMKTFFAHFIIFI